MNSPRSAGLFCLGLLLGTGVSAGVWAQDESADDASAEGIVAVTEVGPDQEAYPVDSSGTEPVVVEAFSEQGEPEPSGWDAEEDVEAVRIEYEREPLYGGIFKEAGGVYYYELVIDKSGLALLFVNDALNKPLDVTPLFAKWRLDPDRPDGRQGTFEPSKLGAYFRADLPDSSSDPIRIEVAVKHDGVWVPVRFTVPHDELQ